jgi:SAM-dependent methyltransferase
MSPELPAWASELASVQAGDEALPATLEGINLQLTRPRLAAFLAGFAEDKDVRDFLALDIVGTAAAIPLSSTGLDETVPSLAMRPFRLWEYVWLYKSLGLAREGLRVLDLGGPSTHLSVLAALAGCDVTSIDINPVFVQAGRDCADALRLHTLKPQLGDMRDLSAFPGDSFDVVISCSVLEHLTGEDQQTAVREIARVLRPGGTVGFTFDYGPGAPGANEYLPPPHDPPSTSAEALRRYVHSGLQLADSSLLEDAIPGCLFHHESIKYTVASLFLIKPPAPEIPMPRCELSGSVLNRLTISELPRRIHATVSAQLDVLHELRERARVMESVAAERLAVLNEKEQVINRLREQLDLATVAMKEKDERSRQLEQTAAVRLAAMIEKEKVIQDQIARAPMNRVRRAFGLEVKK